MAGIKVTPLDREFGLLVKERADWRCECCGKSFPDREGGSRGLHASHFFGRRGKSTRHHGDNVYAHCFGCQQKLGGNPHDFRAWVFKLLGETRYDELVRRAKSPVKRTKGEEKEMREHFKAQREYIKRRRRDGETGYIDFVDWD